MNRILGFIYLTIAVALFGNCNSSRRISISSESIEDINTFWKSKNNVDTPYLIITQKAWYHDSTGITQICGFFVKADNDVQTTTVKTFGYRFTDLRKKWAYEYETLADTASITGKYGFTDTTLFSGGWNFGKMTALKVDTMHAMTDTTIEGIVYRRHKVISVFNDVKFENIGFSRCDKMNTVFQLDRTIGKTIGCPIVRLQTYRGNSSHILQEHEIRFVSTKLPDSVLKVFAAWKKNESLHPVQ